MRDPRCGTQTSRSVQARPHTSTNSALAFFSAAAFSCGVAIEEEPVDVIIISSAFLNEIGGVGGSRAVEE